MVGFFFRSARNDARRSKARPSRKIGSVRPSSRVRLGAKALRCRERWCYRAMVPIPPNGPSPPPFSLRPRSFFSASQHLPPYPPLASSATLAVLLALSLPHPLLLTPLLTSTSASRTLFFFFLTPNHSTRFYASTGETF